MERNRSGQHRRSADRTVIELVSELAKVCPDRVIAAILNRLDYKTRPREDLECFSRCGTRLLAQQYLDARLLPAGETSVAGSSEMGCVGA